MRLVYKASSIFVLPSNKKQGDPVEVGDKVTLRNGELVEVTYFRKPHKPSSEGKVSVKYVDERITFESEYFVSVIGAEWIEREDRISESPGMTLASLLGSR